MKIEALSLLLRSIVNPQGLDQPMAMREALTDLDALCRQTTELDPRLRHYLEKRSYAKALEWLQNPELPHQQ